MQICDAQVIKKFAIPIARSAEAMVIPDPTGTLEEGEIQFAIQC